MEEFDLLVTDDRGFVETDEYLQTDAEGVWALGDVVGALEQDLREEGHEYATNTYRYEDTARGDAMKAEGFVKVIIDLDGEILGCHIVGPDASTLVQEVVVAMKSGSGTVRDIRESVHIHPALPEVVQRAFPGQFSRGNGGHSHRH